MKPTQHRPNACTAWLGMCIATAALFQGCGGSEQSKPSNSNGSASTGAVTLALGSASTSAATTASGDVQFAAAFAFAADEGGRLLEIHLAPPPYLPIQPPEPVHEPVRRPNLKIEHLDFEKLWSPPARQEWPRVLRAELLRSDRSLPMRESPPLASSSAPLPALPALAPAGPLSFEDSPPAELAAPLPPAPRAADAPEGPAADPAVVASRGVSQSIIASGRPGPVPFQPSDAPPPDDSQSDAPAAGAPPPDLNVLPTSTRPLPAPTLK